MGQPDPGLRLGQKPAGMQAAPPHSDAHQCVKMVQPQGPASVSFHRSPPDARTAVR